MKENVHSFVILAYKDSPFLEQCILSLKNQSLKSKIIITTSTPSKFLTSISQKHQIPLLINQIHTGIASDWTFGYKAAKTQYVTLAHQDDVYYKEYTHKCLEKAEKNTSNLITSTGYTEIISGDNRSTTLNLLIKRLMLLIFYGPDGKIKSKRFKKFSLLFGTPISCPSVMYNKSIIGDFEFSKDFSINMDWNTWLRLSKKTGSFLYVNNKLMSHRIHAGAETTKSLGKRDNKRFLEDQKIFRSLWPMPISEILIRLYSLSYKLNR